MTKNQVKCTLKESIEALGTLKLFIESVEMYPKKYGHRLRPYQLAEWNKRIERLHFQAEEEERSIIALLSLIEDDVHRSMLTDHYINGLSWTQISEKYCYSESNTYDIFGRCCAQIAQNAALSSKL